MARISTFGPFHWSNESSPIHALFVTSARFHSASVVHNFCSLSAGENLFSQTRVVTKCQESKIS